MCGTVEMILEIPRDGNNIILLCVAVVNVSSSSSSSAAIITITMSYMSRAQLVYNCKTLHGLILYITLYVYTITPLRTAHDTRKTLVNRSVIAAHSALVSAIFKTI